MSACAHRPDNQTEQEARIATLASALHALSPDASTSDALALASLAVNRSAGLRQAYHVNTAPWIHNMEVNAGIKSRGLCFHYANDLATTLRPHVAPHWQLYSVQSKPKQWLEHNAIVITGTGQPWQSGIVLDGWRDSGVLFFGPVTTDTYAWQRKQ